MSTNVMASVLNSVDPSDPAIRHLRELWDITQDPEASLATKLQLVFDRETDQLDLPYGFLSHTDPATDTQTIEYAYGSHELLQPDETAPLSESYCRKTIENPDGFLAIAHASEEGWGSDPAYRRFELESYVGSRVDMNGQTYGTICFAGSDPRSEPFDEGERMLLEMLSTWISRELQSRPVDARIEHETKTLENIASMVSHDLRNPLSVAQGHVELLNESIETSIEQIESAHQRMNDIIDNMLTLAHVDEPVTDPSYIPLCPCANEAWEMVLTENASLSLECDGVEIAADETRLKHLLENLFRNAIEHAPETEPQAQLQDDGGFDITVEVGVTPSGFYVSDNGPGIELSMRSKVLEPGYSSESNGTGFGLSIVDRIASAHGWQLSITDSGMGGARFEFTNVDYRRD